MHFSTRLLFPLFSAIFTARLLPLCAHAASLQPAVADAIPKQAEMFDLSDVKLLPGYLKDKQDLNFTYLLSLDPDRFLVNFRTPAGLPVTVQPYGGWESPRGFCRGHFAGHYLSACAEAYAVTGDARFKAKCEQMVHGFAECQKAFGNGYLCSVGPEIFANLESGQPVPHGEPTIIVPYYVVHKILAGLLDAWRYTGNEEALKTAEGMGDCFGARLRKCTPAQIEKMFHTTSPGPHNEFGGMSEAMHNLYAITGKQEYLETARVFDRPWFLQPLAAGQDDLAGLHANCHVPQVLGAAREYELSGAPEMRKSAVNFWNLVVDTHTYADGGSSGVNPLDPTHTRQGEHWAPPGELEQAMAPRMAESCVAHNLLKLTTRLFTWEPSATYAAYYERTYFNTVLGTQKPGTPGRYLYSLPLIAGSVKQFGSPENDFWCCYGTGVEAFARLAEPIYYHGKDALWVCLFASSSVDWKDKGLRVEQQTDFPMQSGTRLTLHAAKPAEATVNLYIPPWVSGAPELKVNGTPVTAKLQAGSFYPLHRTWRDGDVVDLSLPMDIRTEPMPGPSGLTAVFYGPVLLAGLTNQGLPFTGTAQALRESIKKLPGSGLDFEMQLAEGKLAMKPLFQIMDEHYSVYFRLMAAEQKVAGLGK